MDVVSCHLLLIQETVSGVGREIAEVEHLDRIALELDRLLLVLVDHWIEHVFLIDHLLLLQALVLLLLGLLPIHVLIHIVLILLFILIKLLHILRSVVNGLLPHIILLDLRRRLVHLLFLDVLAVE